MKWSALRPLARHLCRHQEHGDSIHQRHAVLASYLRHAHKIMDSYNNESSNGDDSEVRPLKKARCSELCFRTYSKIEELHGDYRDGILHPNDVKLALAKAINEILQPVCDHFEKHPDAQALLDTVKEYRRIGGSQMQSGGDHTTKEPERSSA